MNPLSAATLKQGKIDKCKLAQERLRREHERMGIKESESEVIEHKMLE